MCVRDARNAGIEPGSEHVRFIFNDPLFEHELLRLLGHARSGGADVAECLATARRIDDGDAASWHAQWTALADRVHSAAEASLVAGRLISARDGYLRAADYYRASWRFLIGMPPDPRVEIGWEFQVDAFRKAAGLLPFPIEPVAIPYEGGALPGYFCRVDDVSGAAAPRPALIVAGGHVGTAEDSYFAVGAVALTRGYHCLVFDGPGQGASLLRRGLGFCPGWERVAGAVVDYLLSRPEVDAGRVALFGRGWGGRLAARAARAERRLAACVIDAPPARATERADALRARLEGADPAALAAALDELMRDPAINFVVHRGMWSHAVATPSEYVRALAAYASDDAAGPIWCPTFVRGGADESGADNGDAARRALARPWDYALWEHEERAGVRSPPLASVFDWLDETLAFSPGAGPATGGVAGGAAGDASNWEGSGP